MIIVSHDRYFLNRVTTDILAFEGQDESGRGVVLYHKDGDYESYHEWIEKNRSQLGLASDSKAAKYAKLVRQ
jgi:ATPase subunit of ABC transporter with duplicated ATPase domains